MTGNDSYDRAEERRLAAGQPDPARRGFWSGWFTRPQSAEQVVGTAAASAGVSLLTGLTLNRDGGSTLTVALGVGTMTLLVHGIKYRRWNRRGRLEEPPPTLPPYNDAWPPAP